MSEKSESKKAKKAALQADERARAEAAKTPEQREFEKWSTDYKKKLRNQTHAALVQLCYEQTVRFMRIRALHDAQQEAQAKGGGVLNKVIGAIKDKIAGKPEAEEAS